MVRRSTCNAEIAGSIPAVGYVFYPFVFLALLATQSFETDAEGSFEDARENGPGLLADCLLV